MAGKEQGANLTDCFYKKLLTTLTAQNSACIKCSTIFLSTLLFWEGVWVSWEDRGNEGRYHLAN